MRPGIELVLVAWITADWVARTAWSANIFKSLNMSAELGREKSRVLIAEGRLPRHKRQVPCTSPDAQERFLYAKNNTCLKCPSSCEHCVGSTDSYHYPCTSCNEPFGFFPRPSAFDGSRETSAAEDGAVYEGMCFPCLSVNKILTTGAGRLRLTPVSEEDVLEGRVEVLYNGSWSAVCDDGWSSRNTAVVCKELGFGRAVEHYKEYDRKDAWNLSSIPILVDNVACDGTEASLVACPRSVGVRVNCEEHETIGVRCSGPINKRVCVVECPVGQFRNSSSKECSRCSPICLECGDSPVTCTACETPRYLTPPGRCMTSCPREFHGDVIIRECLACDSKCQTCADGTTNDICTACVQPYILSNQTCVTQCSQETFQHIDDELQPICVARCPSGYYPAEGRCRQCSLSCPTCIGSAANCTSCRLKTYLQRSPSQPDVSRCVRQCSGGHYPGPDQVCRRCDSASCKQCLLGGLYCVQCTEGTLAMQGRCLHSCPAGFFPVRGACQPRCPEGFYGDPARMACRPCVPVCRRCHGDAADACDQCHVGYYLKNGACVLDCGDGFVSQSGRLNPKVRLVGSNSKLEGRVEVHEQGAWAQLCGGDGWNMDAAAVVCQELRLGIPLKVTQDDRFGSSGQALASPVRCTENATETSITECLTDMGRPTLPSCSRQIAGVYCSGPEVPVISECHRVHGGPCVGNGQCPAGVACVSLHAGLSHVCGDCPPGLEGDGDTCKVTASTNVSIVYPEQQETVIANWPQDVPLTLLCLTDATYSGSIEWKMNNFTMVMDWRWRVEEDGSLSIFQPAGREYSATYTCSDDYGSSRAYLVTVQERVQITALPRDWEGYGNVTLECNHFGYPPPVTRWFKDGTEIVIGVGGAPKQFRLLRDGSLRIAALMAADSGVYRCLVENAFTSDTAEAIIHVKGPATILDQSPELIAALDTDFHHRCVAGGAPTPFVSWKRDNEDIVNTDRFTVSFDGELIIRDVTYDDAGVYKCVAKNDLGPLVAWQTRIIVMALPTCAINPEEIEVSLNKAATLHCEASGDPPPELTWRIPSRGDFDEGTDDFASGVTAKGGLLTMKVVKKTDAGQVICEAANPAGKVTAYAWLTVRYPPVFVSAPSNATVLAGWPSLIPWTVDALPRPKLYWLHNRTQRLSELGYNATAAGLFFVPIWPDDSGMHTITAENSEGTLVGSSWVDVKRNLSLPTIAMTTLNNVTLSFGAGYPRNKPTTHYYIWLSELSDNRTSNETSYTDIDVNPLDLALTFTQNVSERIQKENVTFELVIALPNLPDELVLGDGNNFTSLNNKLLVTNRRLEPYMWYATFMMAVRVTDTGYALQGVTRYLYVQTTPTEASPAGSNAGVIAAVVVVLLLLVALVVGIVLLHRKKYIHRCYPLNKLLSYSKALGRADGLLDVESYLEQFNADSSPKSSNASGGRPDNTKVEACSHTTFKTLYIPTEDEIDALQGVGIDYYEDDCWLGRVPSGILDMSTLKLKKLRRDFAEIQEKKPEQSEATAFKRSNSDPSLCQSQGLGNRTGMLRRMSSDHLLDRYLLHELPARPEDELEAIQLHDSLHVSLNTDPDRVAVKPVTRLKRKMSKDSKQSDSGFESSEVYPKQQLSGHVEAMSSGMLDDSSGWRRKHSMSLSTASGAENKAAGHRKRRKGRGKRLHKLKQKSLGLLSKILSPVNQADEDDYVADDSGNSEPETEPVVILERPPAVGARPDYPPSERMDSLDMENAYIDPSAIVSVPLHTQRMQGLQEVEAARRAPKLFDIAKEVIQRRRSSAVLGTILLGPAQEDQEDEEASQGTIKIPTAATECAAAATAGNEVVVEAEADPMSSVNALNESLTGSLHLLASISRDMGSTARRPAPSIPEPAQHPQDVADDLGNRDQDGANDCSTLGQQTQLQLDEDARKEEEDAIKAMEDAIGDDVDDTESSPSTKDEKELDSVEQTEPILETVGVPVDDLAQATTPTPQIEPHLQPPAVPARRSSPLPAEEPTYLTLFGMGDEKMFCTICDMQHLALWDKPPSTPEVAHRAPKGHHLAAPAVPTRPDSVPGSPEKKSLLKRVGSSVSLAEVRHVGTRDRQLRKRHFESYFAHAIDSAQTLNETEGHVDEAGLGVDLGGETTEERKPPMTQLRVDVNGKHSRPRAAIHTAEKVSSQAASSSTTSSHRGNDQVLESPAMDWLQVLPGRPPPLPPRNADTPPEVTPRNSPRLPRGPHHRELSARSRPRVETDDRLDVMTDTSQLIAGPRTAMDRATSKGTVSQFNPEDKAVGSIGRKSTSKEIFEVETIRMIETASEEKEILQLVATKLQEEKIAVNLTEKPPVKKPMVITAMQNPIMKLDTMKTVQGKLCDGENKGGACTIKAAAKKPKPKRLRIPDVFQN